MRKFLQTAAVVAVLALAGCSSETSKPDTSGGATPPAGGESSGSSTSPYSQPTAPATTPYGTGGTGAGGAASLPTARLLHFDLDKSEIKPEDVPTVEAWAKYLSSKPGAKVRLEGHCDERGTREYNIGLGERRANAVQQALVSRGASAKQMSVISYGEERPLATGHDEASWSQNRRVEITGQ